MRNTLFFLSLAAGLAAAYASSAGAVPISAAAVKEAAATTSPLQPSQYAETWSSSGWAYKMLSRIRNRPLSLSLVSAVTPMN